MDEGELVESGEPFKISDTGFEAHTGKTLSSLSDVETRAVVEASKYINLKVTDDLIYRVLWDINRELGVHVSIGQESNFEFFRQYRIIMRYDGQERVLGYDIDPAQMNNHREGAYMMIKKLWIEAEVFKDSVDKHNSFFPEHLL